MTTLGMSGRVLLTPLFRTAVDESAIRGAKAGFGCLSLSKSLDGDEQEDFQLSR